MEIRETERDTERWRGGWGGREIKIAERREIRQRLFPQDVVTTTTQRQRGNITTRWSSLTPARECKYESQGVCQWVAVSVCALVVCVCPLCLCDRQCVRKDTNRKDDVRGWKSLETVKSSRRARWREREERQEPEQHEKENELRGLVKRKNPQNVHTVFVSSSHLYVVLSLSDSLRVLITADCGFKRDRRKKSEDLKDLLQIWSRQTWFWSFENLNFFKKAP